MKFEVTDKREQSEGLVFKKKIYYCNIRVELNDEEFETLSELAKEKDWQLYELGEWMIDSTRSIDVTIDTFFNYVKKSKGVWETSGRSESPEMRELKISNVKELASKAKEIIEIRLSALNQSDEDIVEEL